MFISNFEEVISKASMHYPVKVEEFKSGFSRRVSFICGGVVFVCEKFHILYKDVRGTVVV